MAELQKPRLLVPALWAGEFPPKLHFFRNYEHNLPTLSGKRFCGCNDRIGVTHRRPEEQLIWEAVRASSAAPTYFPPHNNFLDGGLMANNPTMDPLTEIVRCSRAQGADSANPLLKCVVSLGTGKQPIRKKNCSPGPKKQVQTGSWPEKFLTASFQLANKSADMLELLIELTCRSEGRITEQAQAWCDSTNTTYVRLNPELPSAMGLDYVDNVTIIEALWAARRYWKASDQKEQLQRLPELLSHE